MRRLFIRHQGRMPFWRAVKAAVGAMSALAALVLVSGMAGEPLLIAPFGASCVLLFSLPSSPLSQPANVIGGHGLAALIGVACAQWLPDAWWALPTAVGLAIGAMALLRVTHPPAGADPLVIMLGHHGWTFLFTPVLLGAVLLVAIALAVHRLPPRTAYLLPPP